MFHPRTVIQGMIASYMMLCPSAFPLRADTPEQAQAEFSGSAPSFTMAAFGDSITRAFNANGPIDHPQNSWSTGSTGVGGVKVQSHAETIGKATGRPVIARNAAKTGATTKDLARQVKSTADIKLDYATILIGANDLCGQKAPISPETAFKPGPFRERVESAISTLIAKNPDIKILLLGIPDLPRLQRIGRDTACQTRWTRYGICKSLLNANVTDEQIEMFTALWRDANKALESIALNHPEHVLFDSKLSEYPFEREHLSSVDCFHPNIVGQNLLSRETWNPGWLSMDETYQTAQTSESP